MTTNDLHILASSLGYAALCAGLSKKQWSILTLQVASQLNLNRTIRQFDWVNFVNLCDSAYNGINKIEEAEKCPTE